jgi:Ni/Fe-hydrogenase 1 B-type cytochrome subunit
MKLATGVADVGARGPGPADTGEAATSRRWVRIWSWPVYVLHWVTVACVGTLLVTGIYIGRPYFYPPDDGSPHFVMGWMRFIHFAAAGVFIAVAIVRGYWFLAGSPRERLLALVPVNGRDWGEVWHELKRYMFLGEVKVHYLGHNPLQRLGYLAVFVVTAIMMVTGLTLFGQANPSGFFAHAFAWVVSLLGGLQVVRLLHHVLTWFYLVFVPMHVYLSVRTDVTEHAGLITSMVTGGRWVPVDEDYADVE